MWDLDTIIRMNAKASRGAAEANRKPLRLPVGFTWPPSDAKPPMPSVPFLGEGQAAEFDEQFVRLDTLFVDTSGFGAEDEPALTLHQLGLRLRELSEEHGPLYLGILESGPFQAHLGVWKEG